MFGWRVGTAIERAGESVLQAAQGVRHPRRSKVVVAMLVLAPGCFLFLPSSPVVAQSVKDAYLLDSHGEVIRNTAVGDAKLGNLCWRTGYWTPALAISQCDPDIAVRTAPASRKPPVPPAAKPAAR